MGARSKPTTPVSMGRETPTLDRAHLAHYTMENRELECEIIALFLEQLPTTMAMLKTAARPADWKLAAHTLKGSAAAVGAARINALAIEIEKCVFGKDRKAIQELLTALEQAVTQFRRAASRIYG